MSRAPNPTLPWSDSRNAEFPPTQSAGFRSYSDAKLGANSMREEKSVDISPYRARSSTAEQGTHNPLVDGSNPSGPIELATIASTPTLHKHSTFTLGEGLSRLWRLWSHHP